MLAASDENQFYRLYNFIFTKPQADAEALILKLQKAVQGEEPTELIEKMEESSDALDKALAELNCPVSLSPQQRQVLVTVLLHPYFQKVRPWNAASSTW